MSRLRAGGSPFDIFCQGIVIIDADLASFIADQLCFGKEDQGSEPHADDDKCSYCIDAEHRVDAVERVRG